MGRTNQPPDVFKFIDTHNNDPSRCWEWVGHLAGRDGRGYFSCGGVRRLAFHVAYELFGSPNGVVVAGMVHRHKCDNHVCCNPFHIEPGTRGNNEDDKYARDRQGYPLNVVREIRRWNRLGAQYQTIADHINRTFGFNISASGVGKIARGNRRTQSAETESI